MDENNEIDLTWKVNSTEEILKTPIFTVNKSNSTSAAGYTGDYITIKSDDWVIVIPDDGENFLMVRQWRHGLGGITCEFPGGLMDEGETPEQSAKRELAEETGFSAKKITFLGSASPNPALFTNKVSFFVAEGLYYADGQHPDEDELISYLRVPKNTVLESLCKGEYKHALMGTALAMYIGYKGFRF